MTVSESTIQLPSKIHWELVCRLLLQLQRVLSVLLLLQWAATMPYAKAALPFPRLPYIQHGLIDPFITGYKGFCHYPF